MQAPSCQVLVMYMQQAYYLYLVLQIIYYSYKRIRQEYPEPYQTGNPGKIYQTPCSSPSISYIIDDILDSPIGIL